MRGLLQSARRRADPGWRPECTEKEKRLPVPPRREFLRALLGFVAASIVIGFLLDMLAITPLDLWREIWAHLESAATFLWAQSGRLLRWFLLGAVIVGPILLVRLVLRARR